MTQEIGSESEAMSLCDNTSVLTTTSVYIKRIRGSVGRRSIKRATHSPPKDVAVQRDSLLSQLRSHRCTWALSISPRVYADVGLSLSE